MESPRVEIFILKIFLSLIFVNGVDLQLNVSIYNSIFVLIFFHLSWDHLIHVVLQSTYLYCRTQKKHTYNRVILIDYSQNF